MTVYNKLDTFNCRPLNPITGIKVEYDNPHFMHLASSLRYYTFSNGKLMYNFDEYVGWNIVENGSYLIYIDEKNGYVPVDSKKFESTYEILHESKE